MLDRCYHDYTCRAVRRFCILITNRFGSWECRTLVVWFDYARLVQFNGQVLTEDTVQAQRPYFRYRRYASYNTIHSHRLSLSGFRRFSFGDRWDVNAGAGISYVLVGRRQGYTAGPDGEIFRISSDVNPIVKPMRFDISLSASVGYKLTDALSLTGHLQASRPITNWASAPALRFRPVLSQLGGGLRYRF